MHTIKKHLRIMGCYFRLNLASALEYRASFLMQSFGMALSNASFIFFWWVAFSQIGGRIAGYSFEDVMFIWAVASSSFGLSYVLFSNVSRLTQLIVTGELDTFLLQPCNVLLNVACARTTLSAYGDLLYGLVLMGIMHSGNGAAWLAFSVAVPAGALVFTAISLCAHTCSFYFGDASSIAGMATEFSINFSIYPEKIYAPAVRAIMYSVLPIALVAHLPLRLTYTFSPWIALLGACGAVLYCVLAARFFFRGLRRYESGNAIVTRM